LSAHEPGPWTELVDGFRNPSVTPKYLILIVVFEKPTLDSVTHRGVQMSARNPRVWCKVKEECF
jgi:hypothetical protein